MHRRGVGLLLALGALALMGVTAACSSGDDGEPTPLVPEGAATLQMTSAAFENGGPIPTKYTCDGEDVSPPLTWSGVPVDTESLALLYEDPDAPGGTWVHWVLYGMPREVTMLPEGVSTMLREEVSEGVGQGINDFRSVGSWWALPSIWQPSSLFL